MPKSVSRLAKPAVPLAALLFVLGACSAPAATSDESVAKAEAAAKRAEIAAERAEKAAKFISTTGLTAAPEPEPEPQHELDAEPEMRPPEDDSASQ